MSTNGVNDVFNAGLKLKLQDRGAQKSGITWELNSVFGEMAEQGLIKDTNGDGLTKQEALSLYNELNKLHKETNRATNYTTMKVGQEFNYTADEMKALAKAAGYEVVETPKEEPKPVEPPKDETQEQPPVEETKEPPVEPETPADPEPSTEVPKKPIVTEDGVMLPRLDMKDSEGNPITDISKYGLTKQADGTYKTHNGKSYTVKEVNEYFRQLEEDATGIDTKWRNKAGELGIEVKPGMTNKEVKEAVKTEEKAIKELTKQAKALGIEVSKGMTSADIKKAIEAAQAKDTAPTTVVTTPTTPPTTPSATPPATPPATDPATTPSLDIDNFFVNPFEDKGPQLTPEQEQKLNEYLAQDKIYQGFKGKSDRLNASLEALRQKYNVQSNLELGRYGGQELLDQITFIEMLDSDVKEYRTVMANWKDGFAWGRYSATGVGTYTNVERITLKDGQRAYKTDQGTFYPNADGNPGSIRVKEELLK